MSHLRDRCSSRQRLSFILKAFDGGVTSPRPRKQATVCRSTPLSWNFFSPAAPILKARSATVGMSICHEGLLDDETRESILSEGYGRVISLMVAVLHYWQRKKIRNKMQTPYQKFGNSSPLDSPSRRRIPLMQVKFPAKMETAVWSAQRFASQTSRCGHGSVKERVVTMVAPAPINAVRLRHLWTGNRRNARNNWHSNTNPPFRSTAVPRNPK